MSPAAPLKRRNGRMGSVGLSFDRLVRHRQDYRPRTATRRPVAFAGSGKNTHNCKPTSRTLSATYQRSRIRSIGGSLYFVRQSAELVLLLLY
jgi:hypothetical protein